VRNAGIASRISVPIHGNKDIKIGLLRNLLKTAGLLETPSQEKSSEHLQDEIADQVDEKEDLNNS
jgi:HicA toxin of bacterial toxin-antitoxin,